MHTVDDLRSIARELYAHALRSVDPGRAIHTAVHLRRNRLTILDDTFDLSARRVYAVAVGKAAYGMAFALDALLGQALTRGVLTGVPPPREDASALRLSSRWVIFRGGHPLPNEASLQAARAAFALLREADKEEALVLFLISGGGSAMLELARDESTTLADLQAANSALVTCGASIAEINSVRRAISAVKGGGLARIAPRAAQISLIVSDTGAGDERNVASGPTFIAPGANDDNVNAIIEQYDLRAKLPASILRAIDARPTPEAEVTSLALRRHHVLLDNARAVDDAAGAAHRMGMLTEQARDITEQHVAEGADLLLSRLHTLSERAGAGRTACLISGGEFSCPVRGSGTGGRNSETALRWALALDAAATGQEGPRIVALSAGTDGIDGNSPGAGALADHTTLARARASGLDAQSALDHSDAYTFFNQLGDTVMTGPTGTNVRDVRILLAAG